MRACQGFPPVSACYCERCARETVPLRGCRLRCAGGGERRGPRPALAVLAQAELRSSSSSSCCCTVRFTCGAFVPESRVRHVDVVSVSCRQSCRHTDVQTPRRPDVQTCAQAHAHTHTHRQTDKHTRTHMHTCAYTHSRTYTRARPRGCTAIAMHMPNLIHEGKQMWPVSGPEQLQSCLL